MQKLFVVLAAFCAVPAQAAEPATKEAAASKWACLLRGAEEKAYAEVDAADGTAADAACKAAWGRLSEDERKERRRKGKNWKANEGVEDDLFSKRTLLR